MAHNAMATTQGDLPPLLAQHARFIEHVATHPQTPISDLLEPYLLYETALRKTFAEQLEHAYDAAEENNIVPIFAGHERKLKTHARDLSAETQSQKDTYILPLSPESRKANGSPAVVSSLEEFKKNLSIFSERSLEDVDWTNVVAAGGAAAACLLPVPLPHNMSTAALRHYYHDIKAPATDVDLYLYSLTDEDALAKTRQIEQAVRRVCLFKTTTIRTRNSLVIASQHPIRHVTIHLRIYRSITEVLATFDVDSACVAFDGRQVWASPRGLAAWVTQCNTIDFTRSSPFYENRLVKYRSLDFEVRVPGLDRSRVDPRVYQRDISTTDGLARLLLLEHLPARADSAIEDARFDAERNLPSTCRKFLKLRRRRRNDLKTRNPCDLADWVHANERSIFDTFAIPYGPGISASDIEQMLDKEDQLLNNPPKQSKRKKRKADRQILHRHSTFFGGINSVVGDCCGDCPIPNGSEERTAERQNDGTFVCGVIRFSRSGPSRQHTEVLYPQSQRKYTEPAYVGVTDSLCGAIADCDLSRIQHLLAHGGNDINGRDVNGRTPLHLAVACSSLEVVRHLLGLGAQLTPLTSHGKAAIHIACIRGSVDIVSALLIQNEENKVQHKLGRDNGEPSQSRSEFDDINIPFSQHGTSISLLHLAILYDNGPLVKFLVQTYNADINQPLIIVEASVNRGDAYYDGLEQYLPPITLALRLPLDAARNMTRLLFELGASSGQTVDEHVSALQACITSRPVLLDTYFDADAHGAARAAAAILTKGEFAPDALQSAEHQRCSGRSSRCEITFQSWLDSVRKRLKRKLGTKLPYPAVRHKTYSIGIDAQLFPFL